MALLGKHIYRIAADFGNVGDSWIDYETGDVFHFPSGVALEIQVGIRKTKSPETFFDLSDVASLKLEIKKLKYNKEAPDADDPAYMPQEVTSLDSATLTSTDWQAGTNQHATFDYVAADTSLPIGKFWMVISGVLNDGSLISPGWAKMEVIQDGTGLLSTVESTPISQYPASTVDSLLALKQTLIALNVADPTITGVAADLGVAGYTNETPRRYFIKNGLLDTDWEQILISQDGKFLANIELSDFTGIVPDTNILGQISSKLRIGDGLTEGGLDVGPIFTGLIFVSSGGTDTRTGLSPYSSIYPFATLQAAHDAATEGDTIFVMPGDFSSGTTTFTKSLKIETRAGSLLPSIVLDSTGKTLDIAGYGSIFGAITLRSGTINCNIDVDGAIVVGLISSGAGILRLKDSYITSGTSNAVIQVDDRLVSNVIDIRNCRIKATGANASILDVNFLTGTSTYLIENSILESNGTADVLKSNGAVTMDIMNVYGNNAVDSDITERISTVTVNSNVKAS